MEKHRPWRIYYMYPAKSTSKKQTIHVLKMYFLTTLILGPLPWRQRKCRNGSQPQIHQECWWKGLSSFIEDAKNLTKHTKNIIFVIYIYIYVRTYHIHISYVICLLEIFWRSCFRINYYTCIYSFFAIVRVGFSFNNTKNTNPQGIALREAMRSATCGFTPWKKRNSLQPQQKKPPSGCGLMMDLFCWQNSADFGDVD